MLWLLKPSEHKLKKTKTLPYSFNIQELFTKQFGFRPGFATQAVADSLLNGFNDIKVVEGEVKANRVSATGTPVWDYIKIGPKTIEGTGEEFTGFEFPLECVTEAILPKKIVETDIAGRDGDVEELMGVKDWMITVRGFVINHNSIEYPEEAVKELTAFSKLKTSLLDVESTFLNLLDIYYVSVHRLALPPGVGFSNVQPFEMELKSKIPFTVNSSNGILL